MRVISLSSRVCIGALLAVLAGTAEAEEAPSGPWSILVKLRSDGPHAIHACAESSFETGTPLARASEDGSDSLDRLAQELGVRSVRAVFRRPDGSSLAAQRQRLRGQLERAGERRPKRGRHSATAPDLSHVYRLELPQGASLEQAAARFRADPHVAYAQPNFRVDYDAAPIDDPFVTSTGSWGQSYPDQWGLHAIDAPRAWEASLGAGVVIAVVDTGVDLEHEDLAGNLWIHPGEDLDGDGRIDPEERNGIDDDDNGFVDDFRGWDFQGSPEAPASEGGDADPQDENGHGTHVAGIAAARGGNGIGISGVAPRATVMPVRIFPPTGGAETDLVFRGVLYAILNGADVVNASFSCGRVCRDNPIAEEVVSLAAALGVAYVTSAGNEAADVMLKSPERLRSSLVVGSVTPSGSLASSSSFGYLVDVVAPGEDVLSLAASVAKEQYAASRFVGERYMRLSGTSMAAPHVSGVLALLLSADPSLTPEDLRARLHASAADRGDEGPDRVYGRGLVAPAPALEGSGVAGLRGEIRSPLPGDTVAGDGDAGWVTGSVGGFDFASFALEIGEGDAPDAWTPIRSERRPVEEAALGEIPLDALSDGAYVLRLRLAGSGGASVVEFAPIGIERNRPIPVSAGERDARNPAIDALRVVWDAEVPDPEAEGSVRQLAHARFGQASERLLAPGVGDQHQASLSAGSVAWLEGSPESEPGETEVIVCFLRGASGCVPMRASGGPAPRDQLQISRGNLVVLEQRERSPVLSGCRLDRSGCALREIATGLTFNPEFPVLDASRLVFGISAIPGGLYTCVLTPDTGSCPAEPVQLEDTFFPRALALSGRSLVFAGGRQPGGAGVFVCSLGEGAECEGARAASLPATYEASGDASGRRVVWDGPGAHGEPDVYFCEHDPESRTCPAQRITSDAAAQRNPRIDGTRIVWEDGRSGGQAIAGFELPTIVASPSPRFGEGHWNSLAVRVRGTREAVLSATPRDGEAIRLEQRSPTAAVLRWRPGPGDAGVHRVSLRATLPSGLSTEREIAITVVPQ